MKSLLLSLLIVSGFVSQSAYGLFDVQLLAGYRLVDYKAPGSENAELSGLSVTGAFHLSPVPLLPVAIGLAVEYVDFDAKNFDNVEGSSGFVFIPELMAWLPIDLLSVTPYAKLGYAFGSLSFDEKNGIEGSTDSSGVRLAVGIKWAPKFLPILKFLLQGDYSFDKTEILEINSNSQSLLVDGDESSSGNFSIAIGAEVGI